MRTLSLAAAFVLLAHHRTFTNDHALIYHQGSALNIE
jgi:hypothetical protein